MGKRSVDMGSVVPFARIESSGENAQVARLRQAIDLAGLYFFRA